MPTYEQLKGEAQLGALEGALHAAVRDYKKEMGEAEDQAKDRQKAANQVEVDHKTTSSPVPGNTPPKHPLLRGLWCMSLQSPRRRAPRAVPGREEE